MEEEWLADAPERCGHRVRHWVRGEHYVVGYTGIVGKDLSVGDFIRQMSEDGRLQALRAASSQPCWLLGLGSWDPEVAEVGGDHRYTVCVEETEHTDFQALIGAFPEAALYRKRIAPSDWLAFEDWKWVDDPYRHLEPLGFQFHTGTYDVGFHFDAYAPGVDMVAGAPMELWITVVPCEGYPSPVTPGTCR